VRRNLLVVLGSAALVAGCASVPTSGPIRSGSQAGLDNGQQGVVVEAQEPRQNADQLPIVNGFLEAMSDSRAFDVARQYMTAEAAARWKPEAKISVYDQTSTKAVTRRVDGTIGLAAPLIGTIDRRGSWTPAVKGKSLQFVFKLTKVSGQWRIANVPDGVFLAKNQLETNIQPRNLYFLSPARDMLVPDPVYLPINWPVGRTATLLVQELLKGPTSRLGNGVGTAAPPGTQVNVSVLVDSAVATVALSDAAANLGSNERELLAAQIAWTLAPVTSAVRITVNGAPLTEDGSEYRSFTDFSRFDPTAPGSQKQLYLVRGGKIQLVFGLDGSQEIATQALNDSLLYGYTARSFAVNLRGDFGAITTSFGGRNWVVYARLIPKDTTEKEDRILTEGAVLRPSFDWQGNLWIVDRATSARPRLRVRAPDGKLLDVVTDFQGAVPTGFRIAPDGVRALLVMKRGTTTFVQTATIAAGDDKRLALTRFRPLQLPLEDISDASWYKADELLVVGASGQGQNRQPWEVNVDGSQPRLVVGASDFDTVQVAASPNLDNLTVVRDRSGNLHWQSKDLSWLPLMEDGPANSYPVYPG
jgi:Lipoprotein LpqB beta-propeller domain/Sporulation and spore germination